MELVAGEPGLSFILYLDGDRINDQPEEKVRVNGLPAKVYEVKLKLYQPQGGIIYLVKHVVVEEGYITTYKVIWRDDIGNYVIRLAGMEEIPLPPPNQQNVPPQGTNSNVNVNVNINLGGAGHTHDHDHDHGGDTPPPPPPPPSPLPGYTGPIGCDYPISDQELNSILNTLRNTDFEHVKEQTAKTIIKSKCFLVGQLKQILQTFDFEHTKLEVAKFAYPYVYDQGNYYMLNDVFDFPSSVEELNYFINSRQ